ncbi:MAG TPA: hypothetical protein VFZ66_07545 [Herpetosiphonaceae bacterium]
MVLRARVHESKPMVGMILAFKNHPSHPLAAIPARVIYVWPRFRSGDYLVTLEYDRPIKFKNEFITRIDAFMSELQPGY